MSVSILIASEIRRNLKSLSECIFAQFAVIILSPLLVFRSTPYNTKGFPEKQGNNKKDKINLSWKSGLN